MDLRWRSSTACRARTAQAELSRAGRRALARRDPPLDPPGFSPAVMQSNNDFSVGGTLSVNAHGWPVAFGPFASTVRSFRLMLADGTVSPARAPRTPNCSARAGGYGLFGIMLDAEIDMVDNELLRRRYEVVAADKFAQRFVAAATEPDVRMTYGRLSVAREDFWHRRCSAPIGRPLRAAALPRRAALEAPTASCRAQLFRAQIGSERGKKRALVCRDDAAAEAPPTGRSPATRS